MRRRLYLMRHGAVAYFDGDGRPVAPDDVPLTGEGVAQAEAARELLAEARLDRVLASTLPRTQQTAAIVAPAAQVEVLPELREIRGGRLSELPAHALEREFTGAFRGVVPPEQRFLGGETIGELLDRVVPVIEGLAADADWDTALVVAHGGVNRAILSYALTGERVFFGRFEQATGCVNVIDVGADDWIVRAVNVAPADFLHAATRATTMETYWRQYRGPGATG